MFWAGVANVRTAGLPPHAVCSGQETYCSSSPVVPMPRHGFLQPRAYTLVHGVVDDPTTDDGLLLCRPTPAMTSSILGCPEPVHGNGYLMQPLPSRAQRSESWALSGRCPGPRKPEYLPKESQGVAEECGGVVVSGASPVSTRNTDRSTPGHHHPEPIAVSG